MRRKWLVLLLAVSLVSSSLTAAAAETGQAAVEQESEETVEAEETAETEAAVETEETVETKEVAETEETVETKEVADTEETVETKEVAETVESVGNEEDAERTEETVETEEIAKNGESAETVSEEELVGVDEDLPQVDAPSGLEWSKESSGSMTWGLSVNGSGMYHVSIYREGDTEPVFSGPYHVSALEGRTSVTWPMPCVAADKMTTGDYYFTVYAYGDGVSYSDSPVSKSGIFSYEKPEKKLAAPTDLKWQNSTTGIWSTAEVGGYEIELHFKAAGGTTFQAVWGTSTDRDASEGNVCALSDGMNESGVYKFRVRCTSTDILVARDSDWSDFSPEISTEENSGDVADTLQNLLDNGAGADALLNALVLQDKSDLILAIQTESDVQSLVGQAEKQYAQEKGISVDTQVASELSGKIQGTVSILGAAFNAASNVTKMSLKLSQPALEKEVDKEQYKNVVQINMSLDGAENSQNLKVPVRITMPIPAGVSAEDLQILHYHNDGTMEVIYPYVSGNTTSFTLTSFSTFVFANTNKDSAWPFTDVEIAPGGWKYDSIKYVYENNVMNGITKNGKITTFEPDSPLTRAMFATVLYRMAGSPVVTWEDRFSDVSKGWYYSDAVIWAYKNKIVNGYADGSYGVYDNITREQIAKMLMVYAQVQGYNTSERANLNTFPDRNKISGWAPEYVRWAVGVGMINGKNINGTYYLDPQGEATRAECAAMLTRFLKKYQ